MKNYKAPEFDIVKYQTEDIITDSGLNPGDNAEIGGNGGIFVPVNIDSYKQ